MEYKNTQIFLTSSQIAQFDWTKRLSDLKERTRLTKLFDYTRFHLIIQKILSDWIRLKI